MEQVYNYEMPSNRPVSTDDLINDLKRVASKISKNTVTQKEYRKIGKYDDTTISRRFGSWNNALKEVGLGLSNENNISDERLFENILKLWQYLGRQPRRKDLEEQISEFSQSPYNRRFKNWTNAMLSFIDYANSEEKKILKTNIIKNKEEIKKNRNPSLRLRYKVLVRDRFSCKICGASPAKDNSVVLQIDHIIPWSKGGETTYENLQTLCSKCNLGKSNL